MSFWRQLEHGLRAMGNRRAADQDVADEVSSFLEESAAEHVAQGFSADEARRAAHVELGSVAAVREQVRASGWDNRIDNFLSDLRYATRRLAARPGFTAITVMTLALGMSASTAIFSVINGVLLRPLPYPQSGRLVALLHTAPGINIPEMNLAASLYLTYSEENRVFQEVGMWIRDSWTVTGLARPEEMQGLSISHRFLPALALRRRFDEGSPQPTRIRPANVP